MSLLSVRHLKVWFPIRKGIFNRVAGYIRAVDDVSFELAEGETLGIVGESGCGKTTLGRAILALENVTAGEVCFNGTAISRLSEGKLRPLRRSFQMIFQDPNASLNPRMTVFDLLTEGALFHKCIPEGQLPREFATNLLRDVGMSDDCLFRYPHEFSGGQRQRISIARALSLKPKLIVCDEPVSALDVSVQAQVINLLMDLREKYGLSYLFISHDISVVRHISQRVAVMYLGHLMEIGDVQDIFSHPAHPYTEALLSAVPIPGKSNANRIYLSGELPSPANPPSGCPFHTRCPKATPDCAQAQPAFVKIGDNHSVACNLFKGN